jgi:hypothetical protein
VSREVHADLTRDRTQNPLNESPVSYPRPFTYSPTYTVFLEKLIVTQMINMVPAFITHKS